MLNYRVVILLMVAFVAGCFSPRASSRRVIVLAETHDSADLVALREIVIRQAQALQGLSPAARSIDGIVAFVNARPRHLEPAFVRRVLRAQAELDRELVHYQALGGRLWCERPIVESRRHRVSIERLAFVGLPRYRDVARDTQCFIGHPNDPDARTYIGPLVTLDYRLGAGNDLIGDEYTMERYPIAPLPPVPAPVPLPLVCDGAFCHVIEPQAR